MACAQPPLDSSQLENQLDRLLGTGDPTEAREEQELASSSATLLKNKQKGAKNLNYIFFLGGGIFSHIFPLRHVCQKSSAHVDGGRAEGLVCPDTVARTPMGVRGIA